MFEFNVGQTVWTEQQAKNKDDLRAAGTVSPTRHARDRNRHAAIL
jgi:hypothetical protein